MTGSISFAIWGTQSSARQDGACIRADCRICQSPNSRVRQIVWQARAEGCSCRAAYSRLAARANLGQVSILRLQLPHETSFSCNATNKRHHSKGPATSCGSGNSSLSAKNDYCYILPFAGDNHRCRRCTAEAEV